METGISTLAPVLGDRIAPPLSALSKASRRNHIEHEGEENTIVHAYYPILTRS
jgi:hypothetical protein